MVSVPLASSLAIRKLPSVSMWLRHSNVAMLKVARSRAQSAPSATFTRSAVGAFPQLQGSRKHSGGGSLARSSVSTSWVELPSFKSSVALSTVPQCGNSGARHGSLANRTRQPALSRCTLVLHRRAWVELHSTNEKQGEDEGERKGRGDESEELAHVGDKQKERRSLPALTPAAQALKPVSVICRLKER